MVKEHVKFKGNTAVENFFHTFATAYISVVTGRRFGEHCCLQQKAETVTTGYSKILLNLSYTEQI